MTTEGIDTDFLARISGARSAERRSVSEVMAKVRDGYFGNTPDKQLAAAMDDMFDDILETLGAEAASGKETSHIGRMAEGYPLFGLGESGTRKSSTFARMIHIRPEFAGFSYIPHENRSAIISVKAPSPCTLRVLGVTIARAMGLPTNDGTKENAVWDDIMDNLPKRGIRVIHIDEFQHVLENRNSVDIAKIRNTLKRVMQTPGHPVWMLVTGMPECGPVIEGDTQTWRRKSYVLFQELNFSAHTEKCRTMAKFFAGEKAGLDCEAFTTDENIHRLMHASLYRVVTPLQQAIMILKRHRDRMFAERQDVKPISIILTTLSAHSYGGEETIGQALVAILSKMDSFIGTDGIRYYIPNPSDPMENFADKWAEHPERREAFYEWLGAARRDFLYAAQVSSRQSMTDAVAPRIGRSLAERARDRAAPLPRPGSSLLRPAALAPAAAAPSFPAQARVPGKPAGFGSE